MGPKNLLLGLLEERAARALFVVRRVRVPLATGSRLRS
jgi:hypothetical protein